MPQLCSTADTLTLALFLHAAEGASVRDTALALRRLNNHAIEAREGKGARLYVTPGRVEEAKKLHDRATPLALHNTARLFAQQCTGMTDAPEWRTLQRILTLAEARMLKHRH